MHGIVLVSNIPFINVVFQALLKTLDNIRVIIDNENIIRTRCEEIQNSESWLDVNVIDCDEFIFEGSGNETGNNRTRDLS